MNYPDRDHLSALSALANRPDMKAVRDKTGNVMETYCNFFCRDVAAGMGCDDLIGKTANEIAKYLEAHPEDWVNLKQDWKLAQLWANEGHLVVYARSQAPHGHVCIGVPGALQWSPKAKAMLPTVANVGADNFTGKHLGWAFSPDKLKQVNAYAWKGPVSPAKVA